MYQTTLTSGHYRPNPNFRQNKQRCRYVLTAREAGHVRASVEAHTGAPFDERNFFELWQRTCQNCALPNKLLRQLSKFASALDNTGMFVVENLPIDPLSGYTKRTSVSEFVLLALSAVLGMPYGYSNQRSGAVIQNFWPRPEDASQQLGTSDAELIWHSEDAFTAHSPDFIALLCLRGDPDAVTQVSCVDPADLDDETREALSMPWYSIRRDGSYSASADPGEVTPIINSVNGQLVVRYEPIYISFLSEQARRAHRRLTEYLQSHNVGVILKPGDLLVIDNRRAVHARTAIKPRYDGTDRWVQRVAIWRKPVPAELIDGERPHVLTL